MGILREVSLAMCGMARILQGTLSPDNGMVGCEKIEHDYL